MANKSSQCLLMLYEMIDTMTVANGYNFNWISNKSGDKYFKSSTQPKATIIEGDENNLDYTGGNGANVYRDEIMYTVIAKIAISQSGVRPDNVPFEQSQLMSDMRDDLKYRFADHTYMVQQRAQRPEIVFKATHLNYQRSRPRLEINEGKFSTHRLELDIRVIYESERYK